MPGLLRAMKYRGDDRIHYATLAVRGLVVCCLLGYVAIQMWPSGFMDLQILQWTAWMIVRVIGSICVWMLAIGWTVFFIMEN